MSRPRIFEYADLREPSLRKDGGLYAESLVVRADEIQVNDVVETLGTVVKTEKLGGYIKVSGRLLSRNWRKDIKLKVIRRNWDQTKENTDAKTHGTK